MIVDKKTDSATSPCATCPMHHAANLKKLGVDMDKWDFVVGLAGNPNTGKSTVFNALTGLRQHTGNWPGKTVTRAEGGFEYNENHYKLVDLPGTYSLLSTSPDEEVARDFILFGQPDVTVVVIDSTRLERNLNLVLQVLEITDRVVVCLNLIDEARRHHISIDERLLSRALGVPVVPTNARSGIGLPDLIQRISDVAEGRYVCRPYKIQNEPARVKDAIARLVELTRRAFPDLPNARWVAIRLLDGDDKIAQAIRDGALGDLSAGHDPEAVLHSHEPTQVPARSSPTNPKAASDIVETARQLRWHIGGDFHERWVEAVYAEAGHIADRVIAMPDKQEHFDWDRFIDRIVTSRVWGFPLMLLLFTLIFWITVSGANVPSGWLAAILIDWGHPALKDALLAVGLPTALVGFLADGVYLATAWVISVMLPPMAIFFPLFTLLEDFGYLPRVAFNLDRIFKHAGAHGKQALSMMMGFGCNAAGVVSTRIIDSPRERLIAMVTNNFALCNGRWPTQIMIATIFIGAALPAYWAGLVSALAVVGVALLGVFLTFIVSWFLSQTLLRGEVSTFSLELPPYRPPRIWQTIYTSLIDRTLFVLWRAIVFAMPAGAVIWLSANISIGGSSIAEHLINFLDPFGFMLGLNGVILVAYIIAIPANEIVIPTILMLTVLVSGMSGVGAGQGVLFEIEAGEGIRSIFDAGGWTLLTAVNLIIFSLVHNPCSTTLYTIYKESGSFKWTVVSALLPLFMGFGLVFIVAQVWRLLS